MKDGIEKKPTFTGFLTTPFSIIIVLVAIILMFGVQDILKNILPTINGLIGSGVGIAEFIYGYLLYRHAVIKDAKQENQPFDKRGQPK